MTSRISQTVAKEVFFINIWPLTILRNSQKRLLLFSTTSTSDSTFFTLLRVRVAFFVADLPANATVECKKWLKIKFRPGHAAGRSDGDNLDAGVFCLVSEHRQMLGGMSIVATMDIT